MKTPVPPATVERLPTYLQILEGRGDQERTSSDELAVLAGINAAMVRKDLSYLGTYGTRGVGYDVEQLRFEIRRALGLNRVLRLAIVGAGNLGSALAGYAGFGAGGFEVAGVFDADAGRVGRRIGEHVVEDVARLGAAAAERGIDIGVIAVPAAAAQEVAGRLADAGVRSILNFAPTVVQVPEDVEVRRVDLSTELQVLGYHLHLEAGT